jgi:hypothetical protein
METRKYPAKKSSTTPQRAWGGHPRPELKNLPTNRREKPDLPWTCSRRLQKSFWETAAWNKPFEENERMQMQQRLPMSKAKRQDVAPSGETAHVQSIRVLFLDFTVGARRFAPSPSTPGGETWRSCKTKTPARGEGRYLAMTPGMTKNLERRVNALKETVLLKPSLPFMKISLRCLPSSCRPLFLRASDYIRIHPCTARIKKTPMRYGRNGACTPR